MEGEDLKMDWNEQDQEQVTDINIDIINK